MMVFNSETFNAASIIGLRPDSVINLTAQRRPTPPSGLLQV